MQNSEDECDKPLYFLAIGRIEQVDAIRWAKSLLEQNEQLKGLGALKWQVVTDQLIELVSDKGANFSVSKQDRRIIDDILEGLSLYGLKISPFKWSQFFDTRLPTLSLTHSQLNKGMPASTSKSPKLLADSGISQLNQHNFPRLDLEVFSNLLRPHHANS